jgi:predicted  nucleic acid-binding Zn-ribbon protein
MTTLREDLQQLLAVQEVDTRIDRVKAAMAALDTGATLADSYNTGKMSFDQLKSSAIHAQTEQKDAEMRLQTIESKMAQVNKDLYGGKITASRELKNLQSEFEMLERQKSDAEEKVLLAMEAATLSLTSAQSAENHLKQVAEKYKTVRNLYKQKQAELSTELVQYEKERVITAAPVSPSLLARYNTVRAKRKGLGAAPLSPDGSCGACHTQLNTSLINGVRDAVTVHTCEYCGRILVPLA